MASSMKAAMVGAFCGALFGVAPVAAEAATCMGQEVSCASAAAELAARDCKLGRWAAARDVLRALSPQERSAADWLCLARAQTRLGAWIDALDSYDELAERTFTKPAERALQQVGALERRELEARLAWIQVMPSAPLVADTRVTLDGEPIARARLGVEFPVQPGRRRLAIETPQGSTPLPALELAEGEHRVVGLVLQPPPVLEAPRTAPAAAHTDTAASADEQALVWTRRALYVGAVATTGGFVAMATGKPSLRGVGIGSGVVGGISFLTAALIPLLRAGSQQDSRPESTARRIEPWIGGTSAGVAGSF